MEPESADPSPNPPEADDRDFPLHHIESQGMTPSQALGSTGQWSRGPWEPPTPEQLQEQIPLYKILDLVGRGGMGAVYRGWQHSLERYVAIKILPPATDGGGEHFGMRFEREAKTMAKFQHPGIVSIHDAGETQDGLLYIVMEFIEGIDVSQMMQAQGKLLPAHALAITAHVCDALQYAHSHGVIHRDIKPANVMMNSEGEVKVADFGLARSDGPAGGGMTKTNMAVGTPDYVAPESLITGVKVDGRADLYAVGVMLYAMLTGQVPRGMFEMPSVVTNGATDERFDAIVAKAMEPAREKRYQTALEIRQDLDVILSTPKLEAHGPSSIAIPRHELAVVHRQMIAQKPLARRPGMATQRVREVVTYVPVPEKKKSSLPALVAVAVLAVGGYFIWQKFAPHAAPPSAPVAATEPATTTPAVGTLLPEGVLTFGGHRYKFLPGPFERDQDRDKAKAAGGHLITIESAEEQKWIEQTFAAVISVNSRGVCSAGGRREDGATDWTWPGEVPWKYTNWDTGYPKVDKHAQVMLLKQQGGALKWQHGGGKRAALIEWDDTTTPIPVEVLTAPLASAPPAPADALAFGGHRYKFFRDNVSWNDANDRAAAMGGHLATLTTREEDEWVRKTFVESLPKERLMHVGGFKAAGDSHWVWVTGEPWSYENAMRPVELKETRGLEYANFNRGIVWENVWSPASVINISSGPEKGQSRVHGYVVEWDSDRVADPIVPTSSDALAFAGHRYKLVADRGLSWAQAKAAAESMGGHLATITSKEENDWITNTVITKLERGLGVWIGGTDEGSPGQWRWVTGEPFTFTAWGRGEPNNNSNEPALMFTNTEGGTLIWEDMPSDGFGRKDRRAGYLVEWDDAGSLLSEKTAAASRAVSGAPINLLAGVDLKRDVVNGSWEMKPDGLFASPGGNTINHVLEFNMTPPEEYEFAIEFTMKGGSRLIYQILPVSTGSICFSMGPNTDPAFFGFGDSLDGVSLNSPKRTEAVAKLPPIPFGQRHRCMVEVRKGSLRAELDGKEIISWKGDTARMKIPDWMKVMNPLHLGVGSRDTSMTIHKAELRLRGYVPDRLAQIEAQFKEAWEHDVTNGADKAIADLDGKYLAAINRTLAEATKAGKLDDVTAMTAEKQRIAEKALLPDADPFKIAPSLGEFRTTYRKALAPLIRKRYATVDAVYGRYDQWLAVFQTELTQKSRVDDALTVKALREAWEKQRHPAAVEPMLATATPPSLQASLSVPVTSAPTTPTPAMPKPSNPTKAAPLPTLPPEMLQEPVPNAFTPVQAIEWALSLGGSAKIKKGSVETEILSPDKKPKGSFSLTSLKIGANQPLHIVSLAALSELADLRELVLDDNLITDAGLAFLPKFPKLAHLSLNGCGITDTGLALVAKQSTLTHLGIGNNIITGSGLREIAALQSITVLEIGSVSLADGNLQGLAAFGALTTLDLSCPKPLTCTDLSPLAGIKALKHIILGKAATDAVVQSLGSLVQVDTLDLSRATISDYALERIGSMKGLHDLNLFECRNLTDLGFAKLQTLKGLLRLNVGHTRLTDSQFTELSMKLPEITEINVSADGMSDAGLPGLVNLRKLSKLVIHARMCTDLGLGYVHRVAGLRVISIDQLDTLSQVRYDALKRSMPGVDFGRR